MSQAQGNRDQSVDAQALRAIALWAAQCAELALPLYHERHPEDPRPAAAILGARQFGNGGHRDKHLRTLAWSAHSAAKEAEDQIAEYAARAAMLAAALAYTHTDLFEGVKGQRQARHLLGPAIYSALAVALSSTDRTVVLETKLIAAARSVPRDSLVLIHRFPPQKLIATQMGKAFYSLDKALRDSTFGGLQSLP